MAAHENAPTDHGETDAAGATASDRRRFLKGTLAAGSAAASLVGLAGNHVSMARAQGLQAAAGVGARKHYQIPVSAQTVHWGYFSKTLKPLVEVDSGDFVTIETLTHHANDDAERMVQGDPARRACTTGTAARRTSTGAAPVRWTPRCSAAAPARAWACTSAPARSRCAAPSPATCSRCASSTSRRGRAPIRSTPARLRQQRRRLVGLPLQGPARGAQAARGDHHLRGRRRRRDQLGAGGLQLPLGAADRPVRRGAQDHRLSRRAGRSRHGPGEPRHAEERARADPAAFRRDGAGAGGGRHGRFDPAELHRRQHRQLAHRQGRHDVLSGRGPGRPALGRRSARLAGRLRAVRHRDRVLADRHVPAHPAQEGIACRHGAGGPATIRCSRPRTSGSCTASASPTTWPSSGRTRRARSTASPRSTSRCATPSARCATS